MPKRDIISEAARCSLDLSKWCETTFLSPQDEFGINCRDISSDGTTGIAYDADFIESVNCIGYKGTINRFNAPNLFEAKRIESLSNEMLSYGLDSDFCVDSDEGSGFEKTPSYIMISGTSAHRPDGLIEGRIPVSEDLWSKALLVSSELRDCWLREVARINDESLEFGEYIHDAGSRFLPTGVRIAHVKGFDPRKDKEVSFRLPLRIDGITKQVWVEGISGPMRFEYFHYRYSPDLETVSYAWLMGCWSTCTAGRFYLCRGVGQPYKEVVRPIFPELDDPRSNIIENRLIRGLIRIHNHLKNPDMSDEEYLSLLEGP